MADEQGGQFPIMDEFYSSCLYQHLFNTVFMGIRSSSHLKKSEMAGQRNQYLGEVMKVNLLLLNILAWLFFHLSISLGLLKLPYSWFSESHLLNNLFKKRAFENEGKLWRSTFQVHRWKDILPDGASLFNAGYKKKKLPEAHIELLEQFISETKRAELTHILLILPAPLFYLWNPIWAGHIMIAYALIVNVPFIIIQRYNRIRLSHIVRNLKRKSQ